jgi:hypothetical protein
MGHTRRQVRTVQEDAIRSSDAAAAVGDDIIKFQVFRLQLVFIEVR